MPVRVSFYLVKKVHRRYPFVNKGDYVVKLPDNRCFKIKDFDSPKSDFEVEDKIPLIMTNFGHTYITHESVNNPQLVKLMESA